MQEDKGGRGRNGYSDSVFEDSKTIAPQWARRSGAQGRVRLLSFAVLLSAHCAADVVAENVAIETMRAKDLRAVLARRGVECVGCTEKGELVARVRETMHLDGGRDGRREGAGKQRGRSEKLQGDPNHWRPADEDYRVDLWDPLCHLVSYALHPLNMMWTGVLSHPCAALLVSPALLLIALALAHKYGAHNDIPFRQYLRFQARVKCKALIAGGRAILVQVEGVVILLKMLVAAACAVSGKQWLMAVVAIGMWMGALSAGFGAVYILLLGFVIVFANLGTRREGEQSAYPVFNNFQPLQGELRMDQVEAEMRGVGHLRHVGARRDAVNDDAWPPPGGDDAHAVVYAALERNEKVEIENRDGMRKSIKGKVLQEYLDRGWSQVDRNVRYIGIRYRHRVVRDADDSD
jgi:hypothetical protein